MTVVQDHSKTLGAIYITHRYFLFPLYLSVFGHTDRFAVLLIIYLSDLIFQSYSLKSFLPFSVQDSKDLYLCFTGKTKPMTDRNGLQSFYLGPKNLENCIVWATL